MKYLFAAMLAFFASLVFYKPMHQEGVPELAVYASGEILIAIVIYILTGDEKQVEKFLVAATIAGVGVATNRLRMELAQ